MLKIMTWLWKQSPDCNGIFGGDGGADKVNVWAANLRRNLTIPYTLACVTDVPEGIDSDIEIIPLPRPFDDLVCRHWRERGGAPQCYRRLELFAPHAAETFGADRFVSMDIDMIARGNLDSLFDHDDDFTIFKGTSNSRPYNGSMWQMNAGARPQVYSEFMANPQAVADAARKLFIGSDQAVISTILGWHEKTWAIEDGVESYGGAFLRRYGANRKTTLPDKTRLVFFPGRAKPWDLIDRYAFVNQHWHTGKPRGRAPLAGGPRSAPMVIGTLWAYDDPKQWGRMFRHAAIRVAGTSSKMFLRSDRVGGGERAFVRLDQQGKQRDVSRKIVADLHARGCITLPTYQESLWYDDKVAQRDALAPWLPPTYVFTERAEAESFLREIDDDSSLRKFVTLGGFPIISKAAEGASSTNVRLLETRAAAEAELDKAFGDGIRLTYGREQKGYVYWQQFIAENPCDYRVCVVGSRIYGLVRNNRPDSFTASGSGDNYPLTLKTERERRAAEICVAVAREIGTQWAAFDVVFDANDWPYVLELSSAWTMKAYENCPTFDYDLQPAKETGADSFKIAVKVLKSLTLGESDDEK